MYARSPVTSTCRGSPRVTKYPVPPSFSPAANTSRYQSRQAVGPCQTCGANPSSTVAGVAQLIDIASTSPLLKASTYWRTAAMGSIALGSAAATVAHTNVIKNIVVRATDQYFCIYFLPLVPRLYLRVKSLHLVEHCGQRCFHLKRFLYFVSTDERILTVFEKAWALMFADESDECRSVGLPIHRETFQILERGADPKTGEQGNGIFGIFVKVSVENPLIYEIRFATDVKEDPSQVV